MYIVEPSTNITNGPGDNLPTKRCFADLQRVGSGTAEHTKAILDRQLLSVGIDTPWGPNRLPEREGILVGDREKHSEKSEKEKGQGSQTSILRMYLYTSDGGADQQRYRNAMRMFSEKLENNHIWIDYGCLMHAAQLVVKMGLRVADRWSERHGINWTLYSSIAKTIHCWREKARAVYTSWCDMYGAEIAQKCAGRLPSKCVAGRWLSIHQSEEDLGPARLGGLGWVLGTGRSRWVL